MKVLTVSEEEGDNVESVCGLKKNLAEPSPDPSRMLVLAQLFLDVDRRYLSQLKRLVDNYGFVETMQKLHDLKRLLGKTDRNLDDVFFRCQGTKRHNRDAYHLAQCFHFVAQIQGPSETVKMWIEDHEGLFKKAEQIHVKRELSKRWGLTEFEPHPLFVRAYFSKTRTFNDKITSIQEFLPNWCLKALAERPSVKWLLNASVTQIHSIVEALEDVLKRIMSNNMAKDIAHLCLSQSPDLLEIGPNEIRDK